MAVSFGILSTFPPTQCGLATFSQALVTHLLAGGADVGVVRVVDAPEPDQPLVVHQWVAGEHGGQARAAHALNRHDVALVQHEYGIFGGRDGADVLAVLAQVRVPIVTVLHTVLTSPTRHQRRVLAEVVDASSVVVTMTQTARQRLIDGWGTDPGKVMVIAHGAEQTLQPRSAADAAPRAAGDPVLAGPSRSTRPVVLTWGLIGPGKGIEWAIEAMAGLADLDPRPEYRIVGQTHPRVVEHAGEAYREGLQADVRRLGLEEQVAFDARYLDSAALQAIVRAADIVLLPYDSRDQVTSGVLTEAVVAGKPVVSTAFPHAVELLSDGAGLLVPQGDAQAIGHALRRLLTEPDLAATTAAAARAIAPTLLWPAVAAQYIDVGLGLAGLGTRSVA
jgi:glycosyltransferase involved in cell wall biosynthesis